MSLIDKLKSGLAKTRQGIWKNTVGLFRGKVDEEFYEELEELLIQGDVGVNTTMELIEELRQRQKEKNLEGEELFAEFKSLLSGFLQVSNFKLDPDQLNILLIVGVNGSGKTTSLAKLAHYYKQEGFAPLLVAGDTFRAAAIDQLKVWGNRLNLPVIAQSPGSDPAAVCYDAREAARARGKNLLLVDTAGRLHTEKNLMEELKKIKRVLGKEECNLKTLLVLDATNGQNALEQGRTFNDSLTIDGIILTKLDGTAKGGIVFPLARELKLPVFKLGLGEGMEDLKAFEPELFVEQLLEDNE